jgi:hypothetical protein
LEDCKELVTDVLSFLDKLKIDDCMPFIETIIKITSIKLLFKKQREYKRLMDDFNLFDEKCSVFIDLLDSFSNNKNTKSQT